MVSNEPSAIVTEPKARPSKVLLVDDHEIGRKALARLLRGVGFDVTEVSDATSAFAALRGPVDFDFVLTDLRLPDFDGRDVIHMARQLVPPPRISLMTGWDLDPEDSVNREIDWVFLKPLDIQDLVTKLRGASVRSKA